LHLSAGMSWGSAASFWLPAADQQHDVSQRQRMKLQNLNLDISAVVCAPFKISAPEPAWLQARASGLIPEGLFKLYEAAGYLSFGAAPKFLAETDNVLFSYFGMLIRGLRRQLSEGAELLAELKQAHGQLYDPVKEAKGLPWDPTADQRAKRAFRGLLVAAYGSLDILADLIALMFTGRIPGLTVGRAQFGSIEDWLRKPAGAPGAVLTPQEDYLAQLRSRLTPLVLPGGPERDWLPLVRMLRNKGAHLGDDVFRYFGLLDDDGNLYLFVPREWPHLFERHMKPVGHAGGEAPFPQLLLKTLIHEDYISFSEGLNTKVQRLVGTGSEVIHAAFKTFSGFDLNQAALSQLESNSRAYGFEYFEDSDTPIAG